jgi:hypothetical protein
MARSATGLVPRSTGSWPRLVPMASRTPGWRSVDYQMCGFVPLRNGIADDPRRRIPLTADKAVKLQLNQERPRFEAWTGVMFGPMQSLE